MRRARTRTSFDKIEGLTKAGFLFLLLISLAIGGITGFSAVFFTLLCIVAAVGGFALIGFLVIRSPLLPLKKAGIMLFLGACLVVLFWHFTRAPRVWRRMDARVLQVKVPAIRVENTYRYAYGNGGFTYQTAREWADEATARQRTPREVAVYVNPQNPSDCSETPKPGWRSTRAVLTAARSSFVGDHTAQVRLGDMLFGTTLTLRGPSADGLKVGSTLPLWQNPLQPGEWSTEERATVGGERFGLLFSGVAVGLAGAAMLIYRPREWRDVVAAARNRDLLHQHQTAVDATTALRSIDWFQFEKVVARLLQADGWTVSRQGGARPDGGADLVARREGIVAVVQCKHWKNWLVPLKVLRELLGTKVSSGFVANSAMLYTLSPCTNDAAEFAAQNGIIVVAGEAIAAEVARIGVATFPELTAPDSKECPKCGAPMVRRESAATRFWGCTRYASTGCRGRFEIDGEGPARD